MAGIVGYSILIILFKYFPNWIGVVESLNVDVVILPLLSPEFAIFIPWITAYWSLEIILKLYLLLKGQWTRPSRWMEFGLGLVGLFITFHILTGGAITTMEWLDTLIRIGMAIGIVVDLGVAIKRLYRLLRNKPVQRLEIAG